MGWRSGCCCCHCCRCGREGRAPTRPSHQSLSPALMHRHHHQHHASLSLKVHRLHRGQGRGRLSRQQRPAAETRHPQQRQQLSQADLHHHRWKQNQMQLLTAAGESPQHLQAALQHLELQQQPPNRPQRRLQQLPPLHQAAPVPQLHEIARILQRRHGTSLCDDWTVRQRKQPTVLHQLLRRRCRCRRCRCPRRKTSRGCPGGCLQARTMTLCCCALALVPEPVRRGAAAAARTLAAAADCLACSCCYMHCYYCSLHRSRPASLACCCRC